MKRYYNSATHEWYTEGQPMTRQIEGGVFTGIPSEERQKDMTIQLVIQKSWNFK